MRDIKPKIDAAWRSGDFTGDQRNCARVTVQQAYLSQHDFGYNFYTSLPFGPGALHTGTSGDAFHVRLGGVRNSPVRLEITRPDGTVFSDQSTGGPELVGNFTIDQIDQFVFTLYDLRENLVFSTTGTQSTDHVRVGVSNGNGYMGFRYAWDDGGSNGVRDMDFDDYNHEIRFITEGLYVPRELPNVRSVTWDRDAQAEVASCTITFFNTEPLPLGTQGAPDLDQPGYFTFNRGRHEFSQRWNHTPNEWSGMLMPDNILRTYEGYGFDELAVPEKDEHLMQTGVWMIDTISYTHDGVITATCRDVGRILIDQMIFPPITPKAFYPVSFSRDTVAPGFQPGSTFTKVVTTDGGYDINNPPPAGWVGPLVAPNIAANGDLETSSSVRVGPFDCYNAVIANADFAVDGFEIIVDNVRRPTLYQIPNVPEAEPRTISVTGLMPGNYYLINVVAVYRRISTGERVVSNRSPDVFARPSTRPGPTTDMVMDSIAIDTDLDGNQDVGETHPGMVRWSFIDSGLDTTFSVIFYYDQYSRVEKFTVAAGTAGQTRTVAFQTTQSSLPSYNILIFGVNANGTGKGTVYFQRDGGQFFAPPTPTGAPQEAPPPTGPVAYANVSGGTTSVPIPLTSETVRPTFERISSGRNGSHAFDTLPISHWLSEPRATASGQADLEWVQGTLAGETISQVSFTTVKDGYHVYVSVFAHGQWVSFRDGATIPYGGYTADTYNGGDLPFVGSLVTGGGTFKRIGEARGEGPHKITLERAIPGVTKIRLTLRSLQHFGNDPAKPYQAAVRDITVTKVAGGDQPVQVGPVADTQGGQVASTYTVTNPPVVIPGVGQKPGKYHDYTDIVKLLCAWAGFFWPQGGKEIASDGTTETFTYGPGPNGLPGVDPVLGENAGRVWGDFEQTGTGGVADLPSNVFDKKSLLDGIIYVREIIGFLFFIDETGAPVWKQPNCFSVGNDVATLSKVPRRTSNVLVLDERTVLMGLTVTLDQKNVRERVFVANSDGSAAGLAVGWNPNPIGLRRVGGWTDQNFASSAEAKMMADMIALRQLFTYRTNRLTIPGNPAIQTNDQVRIMERVTEEGFYHYVGGISSNNDMEAGGWTYDLTTTWLGERPFDLWLFTPGDLAPETTTRLEATDTIDGVAPTRQSFTDSVDGQSR